MNVVDAVCPSSLMMVDAILALTPPHGNKLRARKVVSRSKSLPTGKYPSWKMGRMIQWESPHELNAFRLLDATPSVTRFNEQPLVIHYVQDGVVHKHYPDIEVEISTKRELWEVKERDDAESVEVKRRTALMKRFLPEFGYQYRIVLAEDLSLEPRLSTALKVLRFGRKPLEPVEYEAARRAFTRSTLTWREVIGGALGRRGRQIVCRLILEGKLRLSTERDLDLESVIEATPHSGGL